MYLNIRTIISLIGRGILLFGFFATIAVTSHGVFGEEVQAHEKIIISGASGKLGTLAVQDLLHQGVNPRDLILVSRTPGKLEKYAQQGASVRYGDFTKPESLPAAYAGGTRMLLISISTGGKKRPELQERAIDVAKQAGVKQIAYTSFVNMDHNTSPIAHDHRITEEYLKKSGVAWTMLRNHIYMDGLVDVAARMVREGRAIVPPDETKMGYVTRADCAAAAAAVLVTPGTENKAYDITGPALIGIREIAEAASEVSGRPIKITTGTETPGGFRLTGDFFSITSTAVENLTGRPATSISKLLQANKDKLTP